MCGRGMTQNPKQRESKVSKSPLDCVIRVSECARAIPANRHRIAWISSYRFVDKIDTYINIFAPLRFARKFRFKRQGFFPRAFTRAPRNNAPKHAGLSISPFSPFLPPALACSLPLALLPSIIFISESRDNSPDATNLFNWSRVLT